IYGCTYSLFTNWLPRQGIEVDFVSFNKTDLGSAIRPNTRIVYFETPINPTLELIDIEAVCNIVSEENQRRAPKDRMYVVVDNTFASPYCQRPIELGADFVIASLTKHISGFGTDMGGVVIGRKEFYTPLMLYRKDYGAILSGRHAWPFLVYGLPSLASRIRQTTATAMKLANFLSSHPKVERVNYPGLETFPQYRLAQKQMRCYKGEFMPSSILYFVLKGTPTEAQEKGRTLMDWLAKNALCYTLAVSLGHCKTLVEHPSSMTHSALSAVDQVRSGIDAGGVRVAVGLEEPEVLMKEMEAALQQI
ncbi:MAG: PLP-dependent transferase, partial [Deltaproteobacteria bacterium]|nr:PLP-dependent transferase [Deltaproteobacteria bacterium]